MKALNASIHKESKMSTRDAINDVQQKIDKRDLKYYKTSLMHTLQKPQKLSIETEKPPYCQPFIRHHIHNFSHIIIHQNVRAVWRQYKSAIQVVTLRICHKLTTWYKKTKLNAVNSVHIMLLSTESETFFYN